MTSPRLHRAAETAFRATFYSIGDGVLTTDPEGRVREMNPAAERLTGWSEAEARGKPIEEVFRILNGTTRVAVGSPVPAALREGAGVALDDHTLLVSRDGTEHIIAGSAAPIRDEAALVSGVVLVFSDQTAARAARHALSEAGQRYRVPCDNMLHGFAYCRMEHDERGRAVDFVYLAVNQAFERMTGLHDVAGRPVSEVLPGIKELSPELFEAYDRVATTGIPETFEFDFKSLGQWLNVSVYSPERGTFVALFDDITERKAAEKALAESEARYQNLFRDSKLTMLLHDPADGRIVDANPAACAYYGWEVTALRAMRIDEINVLASPRVQPEVELARDRKTSLLDVRQRLANGEVRDVEVFSGLVGAGGHELLLSIVQDITERRRAEAALRATERRLGVVLDHITDGFLTMDRDLRCTDINPAGARMAGSTPWELIGRRFLDVFPGAAGSIWEKTFRQVMVTRKAATVEGHFEPLDRWFEARVFPFADGVSVFYSDIADRKRVERELGRHQQELEEAQRVAHVGSWEWDIEANTTVWSAEMYRLYDLDPQSTPFNQEIYLAHMHPDDRERAAQITQQALQDHQPFEFDFRFVTAKGEARWMHGTCEVVLAASGQPIKLRGTAQDITERKQAEDALRESEARFRGAFESSAIGMALVSLDRRWLRVNRTVCQITGYSEQELLALTVQDITHPDDVEADLSAARRLLTGEITAYEAKKRYIHKAGHVVWSQVEVTLVRDANGHPLLQVALIQDITEHRQAEEALRESEARYRTLAEASEDAIYIVGRDRRLRYMNAAAGRPFGRDSTELIGTAIDDIFPPETIAAIGNRIQDVFESGRSHTDILPIVFPAGTRWIMTSLVGLLDAAGCVDSVMGVSRDITEHMQAEEALRASKQIIEEILNAIPVRVFWKDKNLLYLGCNAIFARDAGFADPKDVVGKDDYQMGWREQADLYRSDDRRVIESGCSKLLVEEPQTTPDGNTITLLTSKLPLRDSKGEISGVLGTYVDITERKRAEGTLRLQSAALNAAANAIVITDRDGMIEWVNPAFSALTGYPPEEAVGRNPRELVKSGVHDQAFYEEMWRVLLSDHTWRGEITNRRKDGSHYVEGMTITPVKGAGDEGTHFIAIKRDLTEQKSLERQLLQSQKMEVLGQLAGGIAHDFNNLLTVINGTTELALIELPAGDARRVDFQEILKAGARAARLTRQLLAFSRREIVTPQALNLSTQVANEETMLRRLLGEEIEIVINAPEEPGLDNVSMDPGQLEQVLLNLAVNARDAMPTGGTLTIETSNIVLDGAFAAQHQGVSAGRHVKLTVTDTGGGMTPEVRSRLFEPFFTTKREGKGTGLGLATVYAIVKRNGGCILVESEPGRGACFQVILPRVATAPVSASEGAMERARNLETILLVEDEDGLRHLAARVLRSAGYTVLATDSGKAALSTLLAWDGPVHLLLTDVVMPDMSGPELAARLAKTHPQIPVLFASGYTDDLRLVHDAATGRSHFIAKPFAVAELTRKVREVLDAPALHSESKRDRRT